MSPLLNEPGTLGANLWLLIGGLIAGCFLLVLIIAAWTGVKWGWWRRQQRQAQEEFRRERFDADGTPLPPKARGICDECGRTHDRVYHLPDGRRLCEEHWQAHTKAAAAHPRE